VSAATAQVVCPTCDEEAGRLEARGRDAPGGGLDDLRLPPELLAAAPAPRRDAVRLLVGRQGGDGGGRGRRRGIGDGGGRRGGGEGAAVSHHSFTELPALLRAGDVLVVNTSRTLPAAVDGRLAGEEVVLHFSTRVPPSAGGTAADGRWVVEVRTPDGRGTTLRRPGGPAGGAVEVPGGALVLERPLDRRGDRLWVARPEGVDPYALMAAHGRPIRYDYTAGDQPLAAYQTVFAEAARTAAGAEPGAGAGHGPGSAEMPSAGRPFTAAMVAALVSRGVQIAPITLHTGVASAEAHEPPYPEPYVVPAATAWQVNAVRAAGGRVIAVGTTAVRALESAVDGGGAVRAARGWTELVVTPERGVRVVDGLLTGLHEPRASHLLMLRALSGDRLLREVYVEALRRRYLWHEFGDVNLLLP
jgi:S-adenosylmethionine:tRNA ribosyltransferase-isomerase